VEPIVDLAPGAEDNALAIRLGELIRSNVAIKPYKAKDFRALRGAVQLVPKDTGEPLTLRFDLGRLTVHDGSVGIPAVTFCADAAVLLRLADMPFTRIFKLPVSWQPRGRGVLRDVGEALRSGELKIYGLASHPRMVLRFLRVLSVHG
jgi:hypothetical protein